MADKTNDVNYKPVADDPAKSCNACKHFQVKDCDKGDCFGHEVLAKGTCNYYEPKKVETTFP